MLSASLKKPFERNNLIVSMFALFMGAFFWVNDSTGHRIIFAIFLIIPFLVLHGKNLIINNWNIVNYLSWALLVLLLFSYFWSSSDRLHKFDKIIINIVSTYFLLQISYFCFSHLKWQWIINTFSFFAVVVIGISVFQFYQENPFPNSRFASTLRELHPNLTANYMALAIIFILYKIDQSPQLFSQKNSVLMMCTIFLAICILLTQSRGGTLALLIALSVLTLLKSPKLFISMVFVSLLVALVYWLFEAAQFEKLFQRGSAGRSKIYQILLERVSGHELLGLGAAADETIYFSKTFTSGHTHNIYLATYFHLGIIGLSIHLAILTVSAYFALIVFKIKKDWLPFIWLILGSASLLSEGTIVIRPYHIEWVQFWLPVSFVAARYQQLKSS